MKTTYHLSLPQPCTENWGQMTPSEQGRFCQHCQKTVIDFTEMTSIEIAQYLHLHENEKICGKILPSQLKKNYVHIQPSRSYSPVKQYVAAFLAGITALTSLQSCHQPIQKNEPFPSQMNFQVSINGRTISGKLIDGETQLPVAYAKLRWFDETTYRKKRHYFKEIEGQHDYLRQYRWNRRSGYSEELRCQWDDSMEIARKWINKHNFINDKESYFYECSTNKQGEFRFQLPVSLKEAQFEVSFWNEENQKAMQNIRELGLVYTTESTKVKYSAQTATSQSVICSEPITQQPDYPALGGLYMIRQRENISDLIEKYENDFCGEVPKGKS